MIVTIAAVIAAAAYVAWGIVHHWYHGDLHLKVVLEYVGIAVLGLTIVLSVIKHL